MPLASSGGYSGGVVTGAVQSSQRSIGFIDVPSTYSNPAPLTIDVPASAQPLNFLLRSKSSPLNLDTVHEAQPGSYQETSSVDEPHVRVHNVQRPIIQKVNEIISPVRQISQQVQPVQEEVQQILARGYQQPQQLQYAAPARLQLVKTIQPQAVQLLQPVQLIKTAGLTGSYGAPLKAAAAY